MSNKLTSYKIKWLFAGLLVGIFFTTFLPQFPMSYQFNQEKDSQQINSLAKPLEYSQWPPFLTDPSFDLVGLDLRDETSSLFVCS